VFAGFASEAEQQATHSSTQKALEALKITYQFFKLDLEY
jgi:hypothetical protein